MPVLTFVFLTILRLSAAAGLCIAVVLLARPALKRVPRLAVCLLWAVVLVRLLCPLSLPLPLSVSPAAWGQAVIAEQADRWAPEDAAPSEESGPPTDRAPTAAAVRPAPLDWAARGWAAGTAAMLAAGGVSLLRLKRRLRGAVHLERNVWLADNIETPFILGLFRPRIYLPSGLQEEERPHVLCHEQTHIRRGDHVWRLLACLLRAVHWFNPLVWAAFRLSGSDMETACDEAVLRKMGTDVRADYAASLLRCAAGRRLFPGASPTFGTGGPERRIRHVLTYRPPAVRTTLLGAAVAVILGAVLLTGVSAAMPGSSDPTYSGAVDLPMALHTDSAAVPPENLTPTVQTDGAPAQEQYTERIDTAAAPSGRQSAPETTGAMPAVAETGNGTAPPAGDGVDALAARYASILFSGTGGAANARELFLDAGADQVLDPDTARMYLISDGTPLLLTDFREAPTGVDMNDPDSLAWGRDVYREAAGDAVLAIVDDTGALRTYSLDGTPRPTGQTGSEGQASASPPVSGDSAEPTGSDTEGPVTGQDSADETPSESGA